MRPRVLGRTGELDFHLDFRLVSVECRASTSEIWVDGLVTSSTIPRRAYSSCPVSWLNRALSASVYACAQPPRSRLQGGNHDVRLDALLLGDGVDSVHSGLTVAMYLFSAAISDSSFSCGPCG